MTVPKLDEQAVFNVARQIDAREARRLYLEQACGDDIDLFARVEALLRVYDEQQSFLQPTDDGWRGAVERPPTDEGPGNVIGPYKLLQQIGEGGMGVVFMAEQTEPVRRKMAIKLIKPGMDSKQVIARFEAERQALAMMDHANIARVLDASATQSGRPYFVMELVHGVPITKYCDDNHLTPRERLELFVPVCHAIQHAHQKGVIHRDIKPSNIMVTLYDGRPVAKVIDFGVAKATEQRLTERTLFTQYGTLVGTFQYMSPEQAEMSALGVDTRSDIYSLGVVLYELLTGNTPLSQQQVREAAYAEVLRMIKEEEPPKPSTRLSESGEAMASISAQRKTDPVKLARLVRGELDWIVMKCLEKDRNRRYETANSFSADLLRYLSDEPVQACPPSAMYRFGKFARRNKRILAMAALVGIALCVGTAISTWQALRAIQAETLAEKRLGAEMQARAEAVANLQKAREAGEEFFTLVSESKLLEEPGLQPLRKELLEAAVNYYEGLATLRQTSDFESLADLAATQLRMVQIYYQTGFQDFHISALEKALVLMEKLLNEHRDDAARHERLAGFWHGGRQLGGVVQPVGRERAFQAYEHAIAVWERLVECYPEVIGFQSDLSKFHHLLGNQQFEADRREDALRSRRRVQEIREGIVKSAPGVYEHIAELAYAYIDVARSIENSDAERAEILYRRAVEIQKDAPGVPSYQEFLAVADESLALFLIQRNRPEAALPHYREARRIFQKLVAQYPHVSPYRQTLDRWERDLNALEFQQSGADVLQDADALMAKGAFQEALAEYSRVIELAPQNAMGWIRRGQTYRNRGEYDKALADLNKAIELDPNDLAAWINRGTVYKELQQYDKALADYSRAIELDPKNVAGWSRRAEFFIGLALWPEAAADFERVFQIEEPADSLTFLLHAIMRRCVDDGPGYYEVCQRMLTRFANSTNPDDRSCIARALVLSPEPGVEPSRTVAFAEQAVANNKRADRVAHVGLARYRAGEFERAVAALEESLALDVNFKPADVHSALAMALHRLGRKEQARAALDKARSMRQEGFKTILKCEVGSWPGHWWKWNAVFQELFCREAHNLLHGSPPEDPYLLLLRGRGLEAVGRADEARAEFDRALELLPDELLIRVYRLPNVDRSDAFAAGLADLRQFLKEHPEQSAEARIALARAHLRLGRKLHELTRPDDAESILTSIDSLAHAEELGVHAAGAASDRAEIGFIYRKCAAQLASRENHDTDADDLCQRDIAVFEKLTGDFPNNPAWAEHLAHALRLWGFRLSHTRRQAEAQKVFSRALNVLEKAGADFPDSMPNQQSLLSDTYVKLRYWEALAYLNDGETNGYRGACDAMLDRLSQTDNPDVAHWLAWAAVLAPQAVDDANRAVALAERAVASDPNNAQFSNTLGAALYRAGRFDDAVARFDQLNAACEHAETKPINYSPAYSLFFLALAHQRLGHAEEARRWFDKAAAWAEEEIKSGGVAWNRRLTLELLGREAESVINGAPDAPPTDPKEEPGEKD